MMMTLFVTTSGRPWFGRYVFHPRSPRSTIPSLRASLLNASRLDDSHFDVPSFCATRLKVSCVKLRHRNLYHLRVLHLDLNSCHPRVVIAVLLRAPKWRKSQYSINGLPVQSEPKDPFLRESPSSAIPLRLQVTNRRQYGPRRLKGTLQALIKQPLQLDPMSACG